MFAVTYARKSSADPKNPGKSVSDQRREALVRAVVGVAVHRSLRPRGARGFDPSRVSLSWL